MSEDRECLLSRLWPKCRVQGSPQTGVATGPAKGGAIARVRQGDSCWPSLSVREVCAGSAHVCSTAGTAAALYHRLRNNRL